MAVFYLKYRPSKFIDMVGQEDIVKTLFAQLQSGKIAHGYLFCGPRGTGKTSTARIFAKAVNCISFGKDPSKKNIKFGEPCNRCVSCLAVSGGSHLDLIEIDAASNRLIEDVRDLREKIKLSPVFSRFKVYIIDEAHMLTREAFNALLKTLEEPPAHAIFILCTTEPSKLPQTIISRVQRFNFTRASDYEICKLVEKIAKSEGIKIEKEAILAIVKAADGSFRDAVSFLDQLSYGKGTISHKDVKSIALLSDWNQLFEFVENLINFKLKEAVLTVEKNWQEGIDLAFFAKEVILFLEKLLFIKISAEEAISDLDPGQIEKLKLLSLSINLSKIEDLIKLFLIAEGEIKLYPLPQIPLVLACCKYCLSKGEQNYPQLLSKVDVPDQEEDKKEEGLQLHSKRSPLATKVNNLKGFQKNWATFLEKMRPKNTHLMAILRTTRPSVFDGETLTLEVFYRFHREKLAEPKISHILEEVLEEVFGKRIKLNFILTKRETRLPKAVVASNVVDIDEKELEVIAKEIFSR